MCTHIGIMQSTKLAIAAATACADNATLLDEMIRDIRTISYLLHPPMPDERGLSSALRWYVEGFCERSKIVVDLDIQHSVERFGNDIEIALFRVVTEALTNVHGHSGSRYPIVRLARGDRWIRVEIEDGGKGVSTERPLAPGSSIQLGVDLRGTQERMAQVRSALEIRSDVNGTAVGATHCRRLNRGCDQTL
jgi:signal transduction histidine kinase